MRDNRKKEPLQPNAYNQNNHYIGTTLWLLSSF